MTDPIPSERVYYRDKYTGDLGYLVERDGETLVRLDRPNEEILKPFTRKDGNIRDEWVEEKPDTSLTRIQIGQVAFAADRALCLFVGLHSEAKQTWLEMRENQRIKFSQDGPPDHPLRRALFEAIVDLLMEER